VSELLFRDLVVVPELQILLDSLYRATGIPSAVIEPDGTILTASGWQEACTEFHRKCPASAARCGESDAYIFGHLHEGPFVGYICKNGLNDYACPIMIEGEHLATLFTGQLFLEPPDDDFFREQALEFGFEPEPYLAAIHRIPIIEKDRIPAILEFLAEMAQNLAATGISRLRERTATQMAIDMAEERFRVAAESLSDIVYEWDLADRITWFGNVDAMMGYEEGGFPRTMAGWGGLLHPDDRTAVMTAIERHLKDQVPFAVEYRVWRKDGGFCRWAARGRVVDDGTGEPRRWIGSITDVTDLRRQEEELVSHRDRLEELVAERTLQLQRSKHLLDETGRLARVGGWEIDLRKNELYWSDVVHKIHEVGPDFRPTVEAAINFYAPEAVPVISAAVGLAITDGLPFDVELELITAKQNRLWVRAVGEVVREDGKIAKVRGVFQDIDAPKRAELELKKHREHLEELVEKRTAELRESQVRLLEAQRIARLGSWEWDAVNDVIIGSLEFYSLFDCTPQEITQFAQFIDRIHPDDRERVRREISEALEQRRPYATEYRVWLSDETWREIGVRGQVNLDLQGNPTFMRGTCIDITEQRQAARRALEEEQKARTFLDTTTDLVTVVDSAGMFTYVNASSKHFFGLEPDETIGRAAFDFVHPDDRAQTLASFGKWIGERVASASFENRQVAVDGSVRETLWTIVPRYKGEQVESIWSIARDISERTRAEHALREANQNLNRSNSELAQFAYVASHDLQEPLRMVSSYTQLLARRYKDQLDQDAKDFIGYAVDGANRMQRLIQDLLEYSRVTSRGQAPVPLDAHDALGLAVTNLQAAIQETSAMVANGELPMILGDRSQIAQVFQNLLGNAIKFHKPDEPPRVSVSATPTSDRPEFWTFRIEDNGIGIEPRHFERLFVIFQRLHGKQEYPGTGIGLALCKRIVERHGGTIWLESEAGKGTTFFFTLPSAP